MDRDILIAQQDDGVFLVAANSSPYFCFEASSEEEALDFARAALTFYKKATVTPSTERSHTREKKITTLRPLRRVRAKDLVAA